MLDAGEFVKENFYRKKGPVRNIFERFSLNQEFHFPITETIQRGPEEASEGIYPVAGEEKPGVGGL